MPTNKPLTDRIASLKAKKEALASRLTALEAKAKQQERKRDTRRKIIVGAAVLAHAELHPAFAEQLRGVLERAVLRDVDRAVIAPLLVEAKAEVSAAA
jgi:hypothetical protein